MKFRFTSCALGAWFQVIASLEHEALHVVLWGVLDTVHGEKVTLIQVQAVLLATRIKGETHFELQFSTTTSHTSFRGHKWPNKRHITYDTLLHGTVGQSVCSSD